MAFILVGGVLYEILSSALKGQVKVDFFLVAALFGGMIAKTISNLLLERKTL